MTINLAVAEKHLSPETFALLKSFCKKDGGILKAGPKKELMHGRSYYVWRMLMFQISDNPQHQCMPIMADCYLRKDDGSRFAYDERRDETKKYMAVVDEIMNGIPKSEWHGIHRWARALGM
jgi:hypothetical protein